MGQAAARLPDKAGLLFGRPGLSGPDQVGDDQLIRPAGLTGEQQGQIDQVAAERQQFGRLADPDSRQTSRRLHASSSATSSTRKSSACPFAGRAASVVLAVWLDMKPGLDATWCNEARLCRCRRIAGVKSQSIHAREST